MSESPSESQFYVNDRNLQGAREIWILDINMDINVNIIALTDPHQTFEQYIGREWSRF